MTNDENQPLGERVADKAREVAESISEKSEDVARAIREKVSNAEQAVRDRVNQLLAAGEYAAAEAEAARASEKLDEANRQVEEHKAERKED